MGIPQTWSGFKATDCCVCGAGFAMEANLYDQRLSDKGLFYCPNGHSQHFSGVSEETRKRREAEARAERAEADAKRQREAREWAERQAKGANISAGLAKAKLRRVHERVHAGVCPHCNRTFKQLAAHMQTKHADEVAR